MCLRIQVLKYEHGERLPRPEGRLEKIATALECDVRDLIEDSSEILMLLENERFIKKTRELFGNRGASQTRLILDQTSALFASGELSDEDELIFMKELQDIYFQARLIKSQMSPKKYINSAYSDDSV
ncbi:hypothetical protein FACS1894184_16840 [Clostridia bacterium]|nr:hypothetical protein FACS1894184_16840 [Clostridia bacterium]